MQYDHAPVGEVAFRAEPVDLIKSAQALYIETLEAPPEIAVELAATGCWYDGLARDLAAIRSLPEVYPARGMDSEIAF